MGVHNVFVRRVLARSDEQSPVIIRLTIIALQDYALGAIPAVEDGGLSKKSLLGNLR